MENQRLLLAAFLSALILIIWNVMFPPVPPQPVDGDLPGVEFEEGEAEIQSEGTQPREESITGLEDLEAEESVERRDRLDPEEETIAAERAETVVFENQVVRAVFDNTGAQLLSLKLLQEFTADGEPIEVIRQRGSDPYPFGLVGEDQDSGRYIKSHRLNKALFAVDRPSTNEVRFRHQSNRGSAEKIFSFDEEGFLSAKIRVLGNDRWAVLLGPGLRDLEEKDTSNQYLIRGVGYRYGEDTELLVTGKNKEEQFLGVPGLDWVSFEDSFFLQAMIPQEGVRDVLVRPVRQRSGLDEEQPRFLPVSTELEGEESSVEQMLFLVASGEQMQFDMFVGAKRYGTLVKQPHHLEDAVRWGFVGFLAKPLYFGLEWLHANVTPNYGWSIVLMTLIIRFCFFPLTWKSQKSMTKMQELNPKVQAIRNKYKSKLRDKQGRPNLEAQRQMNDEVMGIYRNAGVNPMSGCLPVLLQMPVFFALFKLLSAAVELRNAPWIGWIQDLSSADPYFILPIAMGASSLLMQKMMPAAGDPMQRRIMQMMPIVFTVFALAFPSGLVLYWVTSNLFTMAQQAILMRGREKTAS